MIFPVRPPGHQTIAEIDKTAQGHKGKEDGLLQPDCVSCPGLLFEDASLPYMRAIRHLHPIQKDRPLEKSSIQFHPSADLAVNYRNRRLIPQLRVIADERFGTTQLRSGVQDNSLARYPLHVDILTNLNRAGTGNPDTFFHQCNNFVR